MSLISLLKQDDNTDQEISDEESEDPGESTMSSDIEEDNIDHQQEVLPLRQACRDNLLINTRVPLPMKQNHADTVIARPLLPNSRNTAGAMAPALFKCPKSTLLNKLPESDRAPCTQALPLRKSSGDQNVPQPKASADQNVPQHQKAIFEVVDRFMEAIVSTNTPWPILSDDKYLMVEDTWKLAIEAQDSQRALAGAPVGMSSVCQLPGSPSLKIDLQTLEAVRLELWLMLPYQISDIDYTSKYT